MNGKCIDIGTIQAFLDGETTQDESLRVGRHVADCDACSRLLAVAEDENSFVFSMLEREMNALVPTQRLWSRINDTIEVEKARRPLWQHIYTFFAMSLRDRSITAMAGLLIVFGLMAVVWTLRPYPANDAPQGGGNVVASNPQANMPDARPVVPTGSNESASISESSKPSSTGVEAIKVSNHSSKKLEQIVRDANEIKVTNAVYYSIPGEESYIKTIADLRENVDGRKDEVFTGSSRVAFERDLALVNDSINRMRKVVSKNPRNQAARQVLYSSYQDKIDLLNSVAQKDELMATIQ